MVVLESSAVRTFGGATMTEKTFNCEKCGDIPMALLDGYHFGDRILEGVMFEITITDNNTITAKAQKESADYMATLNESKWNNAAVECAKSYDVFVCPTCGGEVIQFSKF